MAIDSEEFLHLARPVAPSVPGFNSNISPMTVNIQPQVSPSVAPLLSFDLQTNLCPSLAFPRPSSPYSTMLPAATTPPTLHPTHLPPLHA